ncbi:hypothetical protein WS84_04490 [Burkholderia anthina]|nr:hypothetical protein WS85_10765 [Burkholderia anthina]MDF3099341.1 hypothetical protein [Burkholderia semiarida]OXI19696.1 hypothetical protein CFB35_19125 [Burkholderia sp. AU16482]KVH15456.1 hypothetical protein WS84_04490 [Burkholderia anthina]KVM88239.1 hypothetical protein WT06_20230 [Burkholderia anthina]
MMGATSKRRRAAPRPLRPMPNRTTLIEATIDRVDTNLIRVKADVRKNPPYRLTMQNVCYFVTASDVDEEAFKQIEKLRPGMSVRACTFEHRGRRRIAWIRSGNLAIAPYDVRAQKRRNLSLLAWSSCLLVLSLGIAAAALHSGWAFTSAMATVVATVGLVGNVVAIGGLSDLIFQPQRREAQDGWLGEPSGFSAERSGP